MKTRTKVLVLAAMVITAGCYLFRDPISYWLWKHGKFPVVGTTFSAFTRDWEFQQSLIGRPIEDIRHLFPLMTTGLGYPANSYRVLNRPTASPDECYWLATEAKENDADQFGFCAIVRDGKIVKFTFVKG